MSAERLSRLQKWILEEVYVYGNKLALVHGGNPSVWRREVFLRAWDDGLFKSGQRPGSAAKVSFSRSLWGLVEKRYLEADGPTRLSLIAVAHGMRGGTEAELREDFKDVLDKPQGKQYVAGPAVRGIVQAKILTLTLKGRAKAKQLLAASEGLKVNEGSLAIRLGDGTATEAPKAAA